MRRSAVEAGPCRSATARARSRLRVRQPCGGIGRGAAGRETRASATAIEASWRVIVRPTTDRGNGRGPLVSIPERIARQAGRPVLAILPRGVIVLLEGGLFQALWEGRPPTFRPGFRPTPCPSAQLPAVSTPVPAPMRQTPRTSRSAPHRQPRRHPQGAAGGPSTLPSGRLPTSPQQPPALPGGGSGPASASGHLRLL